MISFGISWSVGITKITHQNNWETVFQKDIHPKSKLCEWIASAKWEFIPEEGDYRMFIGIKKEDGKISDRYESGFSVKSDATTRNMMSPLKQYQLGISNDNIQCRESLILIQKYDNSPACVKSETKEKLIERGWASS